MREYVLDLHIHSKYSRSCSKDLDLFNIAKACQLRGIDVVSTADFTHPAWFARIENNLVEAEEGLYKVSNSESGTRFLIGTELAAIKKHRGQTRRLHLCLYAPSIETAYRFNSKLLSLNFNLASDGRPILGITARDLLELALEVDENMVMIPAHVWTPWFGLFGSKGGYNNLESAFADLRPHIFAIETGLSSDPLMNWRLSALDDITLVSNSDAHSLAKLGREANVIKIEGELSYAKIMEIIKKGSPEDFLYTIEFYPEEGKYHYDGHRACQFACPPDLTKKYKGICPKCKKKLTIGVMNRVEELADRTEEQARRAAGQKKFIPYKSLVPLAEILAESFGCGVNTKKVKTAYDNLLSRVGSEFEILSRADLERIEAAAGKRIAQAIGNVRSKDLKIVPGYDGVFGQVKIFSTDENKRSGQSALEI